MKSFVHGLLAETHPLRLFWHRSKALLAALRYGFPANRLTIVGVTGTDGKTTTVGMLAHILHENDIATGALSTAFFRIRGTVTLNPTQKTSPSPFIVQRFLRDCVKAGCTHVVLECSSHGLLQGRVDWTFPAVAAITNISPEHLDYHGDMKRYLEAKMLLFVKLRRGGTKVLHYGDASYERLEKVRAEDARNFPYSSGAVPPSADHAFWVSEVFGDVSGSKATLHARLEKTEVQMPLTLDVPGAFNVENALCALACAHALSQTLSLESLVRSLGTFRGVPGRMERIEAGQPFTVFVDFTVTPQSYEKTLSTIRKNLSPDKRLLVLCGSCGDRMKEKRPEVGGIVSRHAHVMVVTNEDPYTENPETIIDEVIAGADAKLTQLHRIVDRLDALRFIFREAKPGDVVLLCGKGADVTMWTAAGQIPWNEREIAKDLLTQIIAS